MKKILQNIYYRALYKILLFFGGKHFANREFKPTVLFKFFFYQKILRINSSVPWPVHWTSQIKSPKNIKKGTRNPGMSMGCYLDGRNGINFGKNVWIGPKVSIISMNHDLINYKKYIKEGPIKIGDDCWIGANAIILPGVKLGKHIIVAAGAVVTKSFHEDYIIIGGNPAKILRRIEPNNRSSKENNFHFTE